MHHSPHITQYACMYPFIPSIVARTALHHATMGNNAEIVEVSNKTMVYSFFITAEMVVALYIVELILLRSYVSLLLVDVRFHVHVLLQCFRN